MQVASVSCRLSGVLITKTRLSSRPIVAFRGVPAYALLSMVQALLSVGGAAQTPSPESSAREARPPMLPAKLTLEQKTESANLTLN